MKLAYKLYENTSTLFIIQALTDKLFLSQKTKYSQTVFV